jgi:hypothetical protein
MNIDHLGKCADRQHKATLAVAQQLVGLPAPAIPSLPIVVRRGDLLIYHSTVAGPRQDMDYVNAYIMNGSFSLELRFKYLHALETGQKMQHGHELKGMFDSLTDYSRHALAAHFAAETKNNQICKQISVLLNQHNLQFRWDLAFLLIRSNLAFERWRYIYEQKGDIAWFCGYTQIKAALDKRIHEIKEATSGAA